MLSKSSFIPYQMKTSIVRVTSYENKTCRGVLVNPYFEHEMPFENILGLLFMMEEMLDDLNYPQKAVEKRSLVGEVAAKTAPTPAPSGQAEPPPLATFKIQVFFRQNATWQGNVIWTEGNSECSFHSVFELLQLMDGVLESR
jgi:hypothetical protein